MKFLNELFYCFSLKKIINKKRRIKNKPCLKNNLPVIKYTFRFGDKVKSLCYGNGVVIRVTPPILEKYPVRVIFHDGFICNFSIYGEHSHGDFRDVNIFLYDW